VVIQVREDDRWIRVEKVEIVRRDQMQNVWKIDVTTDIVEWPEAR
jgi:hypothetical protein